MKISRSGCLVLSFILMCGLAPEVAADVEEAADGLSTTQEPIWLTDIPATEELIKAAEVAIIGFFQDLEIPIVSIFRSMAQQFRDISFGISNSSEVLAHYNITRNSICLFRLVDNGQLHLDAADIESLDAAKLSRFIQMHSLRWVTEYSPMIAAGLFNTMVQTHLLLIMNKASPEYEESMQRYREAAKLFQGQILFVLVDSGRGENRKVVAYFQLKESQLPALAIYETVEDKWDTLPVTEVTVEKVQDFCHGFLKGTLLRDHKAEEDADARKEEL
ncbi:endoplasmic reticulum resident protein 27 [Phodopus roborovskii]|uniref:Endoplasmic reticulum resident protein 27 n=1 Tax=Phodopus roborovskii TaxID=109678 RepID=A0AAV0ABP0_PHORO|nr:endoplasmic reticulum resident protein 27 [Phodopus roborovskii]CAH7428909.1 Erp27 [Phodopus roborovskii]